MAIEVGRRLNGKVILVTGGGAGLGQAAVIAFAREGARVIVTDANLPDAEKTARQAAAVGEAWPLVLDVTRPVEVEVAVATIVERYGRLDVLACTAGIVLPGDGFVHETEPAVWDQTFNVNVRGTFLCCKYAVRQMRQQGGGVIVNTASTLGLPSGACAVYDAATTAVLQLSRSIALQYGGQNIRCNTVVPGEMAPPLPAHPRLQALAAPASGGPPFVRLEQVAATFVFLASEEASYLTGVDFPAGAAI